MSSGNSAQLDKQVELTLEGAETELDRNLVEALADPLVHLVRNAIDHGVERPAVRQAAGKNPMGQVILSARQEGDAVAIEIRDWRARVEGSLTLMKAVDTMYPDVRAMLERVGEQRGLAA
jgi:two-component system chemotaxis sensor kinase CheA